MIQFTVDERKRLRERSSLYPDTIQRLKNETAYEDADGGG